MSRILKYHLPDAQGYATLRLLPGSRVLSVHEQAEHVAVWVLVDEEETGQEIVHFYLAFTGSYLPEEVLAWHFEGTVLLSGGRLVLHVFRAP